MPEFIAVELTKSVYNGQWQLVARYRLYRNGTESDYIDLVVNIPRYLRPWPQEGERWWVRPTAMAPQKRLVFADAYGRVRHHDAPLTTRTDEEMLASFEWSREDRNYRTFLNDWTVVLSGALGICRGELWRVRVAKIDPTSGLIEVKSVGPHPKMLYEPPTQVALMSVTPIFGKRQVLESDVFSYWRGSQNARGGQLHAEIEHQGRIIRLHCSELRKVPDRDKGDEAIEKIVGFVSEDYKREYLAELVLIEGETVQKPRLALREPSHIDHPVEEHDLFDEPHDDGLEDYLREERENSEPPDCDYC